MPALSVELTRYNFYWVFKKPWSTTGALISVAATTVLYHTASYDVIIHILVLDRIVLSPAAKLDDMAQLPVGCDM